MQQKKSCAVCALLLTLSLATQAEVTDSASNGFSIRHSVDIRASRSAVYKAAVFDVGAWWNDEHTVSGAAANLYIEPRPQGCFCEKLGEGAGLVHLTVSFVNPGVMLRLSGGLGPLGLMGVAGNMTWEFADSTDGTTVTWQYAVGGYLPGGLDALAGPVDRVVVEQMARLKTFAERAADSGTEADNGP
ncbi:MAG: SRPBCC family protein [Gammaproteobacteria bacterium]|nr:MAG: SRPBCC family protein [Gammaproteobacteria bacterium]